VAERFYEGAAGGAKRSAPAALRNREPIADVLAMWLPEHGTVLEIASGSGEHVVYFAERFPEIEWQPSDVDEGALESIAAWLADMQLSNVRPPIRVDTRDSAWGVEQVAAVFSANKVHISPWASSLGLLDGAARILPSGGRLILYGPWTAEGVETAPSNLAFDADLKARNTEWGLRRVEDFAAEAKVRGLSLDATLAMPANNLMLLFVKE
jgi:cyclopropane fatty-acyl-phospholipid synthase-like methyltransferase